MKIAVVGAGAMGSLFGGMLIEIGADVWLIHRRPEYVKAINENGISIERNKQTRIIPARATVDPDDVGKADLIIIFVKSPQTRDAARTVIKLADSQSLIVSLQNGLGNGDIITEVVGKPDQVIAGATSHGATLLGPGIIRHAGTGPTVMGIWTGGEKPAVHKIADLFENAGIATQVVSDAKRVVWEKLLINVGINAITALTGIKNGELLDLPGTREISEQAVREAMTVARAKGINVRDDAVEYMLEVARRTKLNRSSMGQDADKKKQTEINAINGAIVTQAEKLGLKVPVNKTLTALVEALQAHYS
jgi:2-dehydropantoate 2-reductase